MIFTQGGGQRRMIQLLYSGHSISFWNNLNGQYASMKKAIGGVSGAQDCKMYRLTPSQGTVEGANQVTNDYRDECP